MAVKNDTAAALPDRQLIACDIESLRQTVQP